MVGAFAQILGLVLLIVGAAVLWSPWALLIGGSLLLLVPELIRALRRPT